MEKFNFTKVRQEIKTFGWFGFGKKEFDCPTLEKDKIDFYMNNNKLPSPCDQCYKALIFWEGYYSKENVMNFFNMINSFKINYRGKLNEGVVVFYFRDKIEMLEFLKFLESKMQGYSVKGKIQWRKACKEYQDLQPILWKNAKEFIPNTSSS